MACQSYSLLIFILVVVMVSPCCQGGANRHGTYEVHRAIGLLHTVLLRGAGQFEPTQVIGKDFIEFCGHMGTNIERFDTIGGGTG